MRDLSTIRIAIVSILVQTASAQNVISLRMNTDLTAPASSTDRFMPAYDTWRNTYSIGADVTVALAGPAFWVLSLDYTAREYSQFRHPYGVTSYRTYGGNGHILRGGISAGVRFQAFDRGSLSAKLGFELFDSSYEPVYYANGIIWENTPGPAFNRARDASARYVAPVGAVGFAYRLSDPLALIVDLSAHRNRSTGFYYRSSFGLGLVF